VAKKTGPPPQKLRIPPKTEELEGGPEEVGEGGERDTGKVKKKRKTPGLAGKR